MLKWSEYFYQSNNIWSYMHTYYNETDRVVKHSIRLLNKVRLEKKCDLNKNRPAWTKRLWI